MKIKTLAEILAESETDSASTAVPKSKKTAKQKTAANTHTITTNTDKDTAYESESDKKAISHQKADNTALIAGLDVAQDAQPLTPDLTTNTPNKRSRKRKKRFHPAARFTPKPNDAPTYQAPKPQSIKAMLAEVKDTAPTSDDSHTDNLPSALKAYLRTPEQKQAEIDAIKAESRLRWLAFYYLSRREYGRAELKQKLIDKEQDPEQIEALLDEFADKGYQSDYRTTLMLIRENIRKGRGRDRIKHAFYQKKMPMPGNIDELIDMAQSESEAFSEFVDDDADSLVEGVDWLKLAVTARVKKYGDSIPTEQKDKARQLRFLQYRGFKSDVCFQALNYTLDNLDERF